MVAAVSLAPNLKTTARGKPSQNTTRLPLLPSESGNNVAAQRRPRPRDVTSRYLSSSTSFSAFASSSSTVSNSPQLSSRRCASPVVSRARMGAIAATPSPGPAVIKRSQSAERRRPATPGPNGAAIGVGRSAAAKMLLSSKRSLSVSFQGDSFSMPISKSKHTPSPNLRKATPERRVTPERRSVTPVATTPRKEGDQGQNARPMEQHPWPSRSRHTSSVNSMVKSVDLGCRSKTSIGRSGNVVRDIKQSRTDGINRIQCDGKSQDFDRNTSLINAVGNIANSLNRSISTSESATSDAESVCSDNNSDPKANGNAPHRHAGPRGIIVVPARFWQETSNRQRRLPESGSPLSRSNSLKSAISSSPRGNQTIRGLSPFRGSMRPSSPNRPSSPFPSEKYSPSRALASPGRVTSAITGTSVNNTTSATSVLCFSADVRRGKCGEYKISDAHLLRLMYNRQLQWRFANARAEASLSIQQTDAERILYNAWRATSDLRISVFHRRLELERLTLKLKLTSILKKQVLSLDEWAFMEKDHSSSLLGAIESLKASTIRLPIVSKAVVDIQELKTAIYSAVDVLQTMASSICPLLSKVEIMNSLMSEMATITSTECTLLAECKDFLSTVAALQVKDCSLKTHIMQLK